LYSTKRVEFQDRILKLFKLILKQEVILEQLLIRNINLPASVKASIESKINAEQDAQKMTLYFKRKAGSRT
jgi:regulator of protease activity HflC (stomatin/prohibitin superfamily)